jgi:glyceraldehyde 3-phosphate dehydrogenase
LKIARAVLELDLPPAKLDIGKLTYEYLLKMKKYPDARHFVLDKLKTQNLQKKSNLRCCFIFW